MVFEYECARAEFDDRHVGYRKDPALRGNAQFIIKTSGARNAIRIKLTIWTVRDA